MLAVFLTIHNSFGQSTGPQISLTWHFFISSRHYENSRRMEKFSHVDVKGKVEIQLRIPVDPNCNLSARKAKYPSLDFFAFNLSVSLCIEIQEWCIQTINLLLFCIKKYMRDYFEVNKCYSYKCINDNYSVYSGSFEYRNKISKNKSMEKVEIDFLGN